MSSPTAQGSRLLFLQAGKHASATDVSTASSGLVFLEPVADPGLPNDKYKVERNLLRGDGENYARTAGHRDISGQVTIDMELRGIGSGAGDGVSSSYATKSNIGLMLDTLTGAAGVDSSGETTHASDAGTGTSIVIDAATSLVAGGGVMVSNTTEGKLCAREIVSVASPTLTVDRALYDDDGGADPALEAAVAYGSASWYVDADAVNPIHQHIRAETADMRLDYYGCAGNATLSIPTGSAPCMWSTSWNFSDLIETTADEDPTFSAQSAGVPVVAVDSQLFLGATLYDAWDLSVDLGAQVSPKPSISGANGVNGYKIDGFKPTISGKFFYSESLLVTLQGTTAQDAYFRMPAGDFTASRGVENGMEIINWSALGTRPSAGNGALRIHLF